MRIEHEKKGAVTVVRLAGELDQAALEDCSRVIVPLMMAGRPLVVFNLKGITFIDSMGTAYLLMLCKRARARGGNVVVSHASKPVDKTFSVLGMGEVLGDFPDDAAAVRHLEGAERKA